MSERTDVTYTENPPCEAILLAQDGVGVQSRAQKKIGPVRTFLLHLHLHRPTLPEAAASLLKTVVVALFLLSFVFQPFLIPSESMERTLLVGDFLLMNKQIYAPAGGLTRWILPYREVERGDIVVFHHPRPEILIKRVMGLPGDRLRIVEGQVFINSQKIHEPYVAFEPPTSGPPFGDDFPAVGTYASDPRIDPKWWHQMQSLIRNGELEVPAGYYFVMGDNRNYSADSRSWGLVSRQQIVARPLVIYFSLTRPSSTDTLQAVDDRLGHDSGISSRLGGFARWKRIFTVVR
jgi:signal peptidase I